MLLLASDGVRAVDRNCLVNTALAEVGVQEATGNNDGVRVEQYLATVGMPKGYAWCAAFVKFVCNLCGVETNGCNAWVPSWFNSDNVIYVRGKPPSAVPGPGDVGSLYNYALQREAHMFFIVEWPERGDVKTVEGNTSLLGIRDGQGVRVLYRSKSSVYRVVRLT